MFLVPLVTIFVYFQTNAQSDETNLTRQILKDYVVSARPVIEVRVRWNIIHLKLYLNYLSSYSQYQDILVC